MKLIATLTKGLPLLLLACSGEGDMGVTGVPPQHVALNDQSAPFNAEAASVGGTDSARRAAFGSTPAPDPGDLCRESCGGGCGSYCDVLCLVCPNPDLARCLSAQGEGQGNGQEGEGGDLLCEAKLQTCLANVGCPLDNFDPPQVEEGDF
jgi:hypothetical protein